MNNDWKDKLRSDLALSEQDLLEVSQDNNKALSKIYTDMHSAIKIGLEGYCKLYLRDEYERLRNEKNGQAPFPKLLEMVSTSLEAFPDEMRDALNRHNEIRNENEHFRRDASKKETDELALLFEQFVEVMTGSAVENKLELSWVCPKCKSKNTTVNIYCYSCGFDFVAYERQVRREEEVRQAKVLQDQAAQRRMDQGVELCPSCKEHENPQGARYCGRCRADILVYKIVPPSQRMAKLSIFVSLSPILVFCAGPRFGTTLFFLIIFVIGVASCVLGIIPLVNMIRNKISLGYVSNAFLGIFFGVGEILFSILMLSVAASIPATP